MISAAPSLTRLTRLARAARRPALHVALAAAGVTPSSLAAQTGAIAGTVRGPDGPVPRALVEVGVADTLRARATSDTGGRYRLVVPVGVHLVIVRAAGHAERRVAGVRVGPGGYAVLDVLLERPTAALDPYVVTALRRREKALDAPAAVTVVSGVELRERPATTSLDHVVGLPGVDVAVQGLQSRQVVARGFNGTFGTSLLLMTDYRNAAIPSLRGNLAQFLTPTADDLDRIEVLRGPASALYGPNAADGVVHLLTRSPFVSRGTSASLALGGRSMFQGSVRHAAAVGERVAFKLSGHYLRGDEWAADRVPAERAARDPVVERAGGEARVDVRLTPALTAVATLGSTLAMRHVEYTAIGASQIDDWRYDFAQVRVSGGRLFAQAYANASDAGRSFALRTLDAVYDRSNVVVAQVQHGAEAFGRSTLTYGVDFQRTDPRTNGTTNGVNESDDVTIESGAYLQADTRLSARTKLLAAARVDDHSRMRGVVLSPSVALVYAPRLGQRLRATFGRAFGTPTSTDLFLDVVAARLDPLPFAVRAVGVPRDGFRFPRDCGGPCMHSPFAPGQAMPLDATRLWPAVVTILRAGGVDLSAVPAPTARDVGTVLRTLDATAGTFGSTDGAGPRDIDPLAPTVTTAFEVGYRGLVRGSLLLDAAAYVSRRENFRGPLAVQTPNAFLSASQLAAYLARFMPAASAQALGAAVGGIDGDAAMPGIPLATVAPRRDGDASDILLSYRSFGRVDVWGTDLAAEWLLGDRVGVNGAYSFTSDVYFPSRRAGEADLAMNAPRHKGSLGLRYRAPERGPSAELRARVVGPFRMVDGVWIGDVAGFAVVDATVAFDVPAAGRTRLVVSAQNLGDARHAEFFGAPRIGRLVMTRIQRDF